MERNNKYDIELEEMTQEALEGFEHNLTRAYMNGGSKEFFNTLEIYNELLGKCKEYIKRNFKRFSWDFSNVSLDENFTAEKNTVSAAIYDIKVPDWLNLYFPY